METRWKYTADFLCTQLGIVTDISNLMQEQNFNINKSSVKDVGLYYI